MKSFAYVDFYGAKSHRFRYVFKVVYSKKI